MFYFPSSKSNVFKNIISLSWLNVIFFYIKFHATHCMCNYIINLYLLQWLISINEGVSCDYEFPYHILQNEDITKYWGSIPHHTDIFHRCKSHDQSSQEHLHLYWAYSRWVFQFLTREAHLNCTDISCQSAYYYIHRFHTCMCHCRSILEHCVYIAGRKMGTSR